MKNIPYRPLRRTLWAAIALAAGILAVWFVCSRGVSPKPSPAAIESTPAQPAASAQAKSPVQFKGNALEKYDEQISAMAESVDFDRIAAPVSRQDILSPGETIDPLDWVVWLTQMAAESLWEPEDDLSQTPPEVVLAAIDLCAAQYGEGAARNLRERWEAALGGPQAAGETAHNLLLEARLPYGGGSAALDGMIGVNEPSAIVVGLHEFAVDSRLPGSVRSEALIRLRDYVEPADYRAHLEEVVELAHEFGGGWVPRAERLQTWTEAALDRAFFENALAAPAPGALEDLVLLVRYGKTAALDAETAAFLRAALATLDETAWSGPDRLARRRLLRELADAQEP